MPDHAGTTIKQDFYDFMLKVLGLEPRRRPLLFFVGPKQEFIRAAQNRSNKQ